MKRWLWIVMVLALAGQVSIPHALAVRPPAQLTPAPKDEDIGDDDQPEITGKMTAAPAPQQESQPVQDGQTVEVHRTKPPHGSNVSTVVRIVGRLLAGRFGIAVLSNRP